MPTNKALNMPGNVYGPARVPGCVQPVGNRSRTAVDAIVTGREILELAGDNRPCDKQDVGDRPAFIRD
jgi:hypothetical protein